MGAYSRTISLYSSLILHPDVPHWPLQYRDMGRGSVSPDRFPFVRVRVLEF